MHSLPLQENTARRVKHAVLAAIVSINRTAGVLVGWMGTVLVNLLFLAGLAGISYGVWLAYHPLGFIVGGMAAMWVATIAQAEIDSPARPRVNRDLHQR